MEDVLSPEPAPELLTEAPAEVPPTPTDPKPSGWSLSLRILFRFVCSYLILYNMPAQGHVSLLGMIPGGGFLSGPYARMWRAFVPWVAINIFHLSGPVTVYPAVNGSGDSTLDYVHNFCILVIAVLIALVWSVLDRKRPDYRRLHVWLTIFVRYSVALTMFSYGLAKVVPAQFPAPHLGRLIQPYGESSPMGLLWTFMGASAAYTIFSGAAETLGGALLLFRRTTTLGALVSFSVLLNVVMLNFCYDVPVKLYSANLLLMTAFLMAPDLRRLADLLIFNRPVAPADRPPLFTRRWMRYATIGVKTLFLGYFAVISVIGGRSTYKYISNPPRPPLYGIYDVESFSRNGQEAPPLATDSTRWKRMVASFPAALTVRMMDDSPRTYGTEYDASKNTIALWFGADKSKKDVFTYSRPDPGHLVLQGSVANEPLVIRLRKVDHTKFLLVNRGFNWINERPFNR